MSIKQCIINKLVIFLIKLKNDHLKKVFKEQSTSSYKKN